MDPQFEELAQRLKSELATVVAAELRRELATVVADQSAAAESRLAGQFKVHAEEMTAQVKLTAEGYAGTLESIDRRLGRLEKKVDRNHGDNIRILKSHNARITRLEETR